MKKRRLLTFFGIWCFASLSAQSVSQTTIVPQGDVSETDELTVEWTIGEVFIHTVHYQDGLLTQGSQQPLLSVERLDNKTEAAVFLNADIDVYPNPTADLLNITLGADRASYLNISLTDANGKELIATSADKDSDQLQLDVSALLPGVYFLRFQEEGSVTPFSFKVVKK